jgi:hypothetical protein
VFYNPGFIVSRSAGSGALGMTRFALVSSGMMSLKPNPTTLSFGILKGNFFAGRGGGAFLSSI